MKLLIVGNGSAPSLLKELQLHHLKGEIVDKNPKSKELGFTQRIKNGAFRLSESLTDHRARRASDGTVYRLDDGGSLRRQGVVGPTKKARRKVLRDWFNSTYAHLGVSFKTTTRSQRDKLTNPMKSNLGGSY